jgi:drug/metabolite transporter (DMT)-like permease
MVDSRLARPSRRVCVPRRRDGAGTASLVQATIARGRALLAVLAERFFGFELQRRQWAGVALVALGLAFLGVTTSGAQEYSS